MPRKQKLSRETVDQVARTTFNVLPLLRKKLLRMDLVSAEHGMPMSHIQVLVMLGNESVLSVSAISRRLGIAKPNITPLVDRLIELGYVERQRNEMDRRVVNITLLPLGQAKIDAIYQSIVNHMTDWMSDWSVEKDFIELGLALQTIETILGDRRNMSVSLEA